MPTPCTRNALLFPAPISRPVVAHFDGGHLTSDAGGLLLPQVERATGILRQFAACFTDHRDPERIEHTLLQLLSQRIYALALGYEDLNDHDELRRDPLLATVCGKLDPSGEQRRQNRDRGAPLAGKSTLNRLETFGAGTLENQKYNKIDYRERAVDELLVDCW